MVFRYILRYSNPNVTSAARKQLEKLARKHNVNNVLFYVKGGGCNGFKYYLRPLSEPDPETKEIIALPGVNADTVFCTCWAPRLTDAKT